MLIRIGETTRNAMNLLGLKDYPFTIVELTQGYRNSMLKWHPDINKSHEAHFMSQEINKAKKILENIAVTPEVFDEKVVEKTIIDFENDIFKLWEDCEECHGTGKGKGKTESFSHMGECSVCLGTGYRTFKCNKCDNGKFKLRSGRIVSCLKCNGSGIVQNKQKCLFCGGSGLIPIYKEKEVACWKCNGKGKKELKPFNPVIRKGAVL